MKKSGFSKMLIGVLLVIVVLSCVGCGGSANQNENKKSDTSMYIGTWKTLNAKGDMIELRDDGSVVNPVEKVVFSYTWNVDGNYIVIDNKKYTYTTVFDKEALKCEDEENKYLVREDVYNEVCDDAYVTIEINENNILDYITFTTIEINNSYTSNGHYIYNFVFNTDKEGLKFVGDYSFVLGYDRNSLIREHKSFNSYIRIDSNEGGYFELDCSDEAITDTEVIKNSLKLDIQNNRDKDSVVKLKYIKDKYYDIFYN